MKVKLHNPGGYDNYQGKITRIFDWGGETWADVEWETAFHPCTTPMQIEHLILILEA